MPKVFHDHPNHAEVDALDAIGKILDELELIEAVSVMAMWFATAQAAVATKNVQAPHYWLGALITAIAEAGRLIEKRHKAETQPAASPKEIH